MDIVERLRSVGGIEGTTRYYVNPDGLEAADEIERLRYLLKELHAQVWGECPSLLSEDSGGDAELDFEIRSALQQKESE